MWLLLSVLLVLLLVCLAPVCITVGTKDGFFFKASVFGIPVPVSLFTGEGKGHKGTVKKKKKAKEKKSKGKVDIKESEQKKKHSSSENVMLVFELVKKLLSDLPRSVRIRLCFLEISVGGKEAAEVALNYGRFYALTEGVLALLHSYRGVLHGFFARREKISLSTDYLSGKTSVKMKLKISFFIWQLLFVAVRLGIRYVIFTLDGATNNDSEISAENTQGI